MKHLSESRTQRPALHPEGFFSSFPDRRRGYLYIFAMEDENEARRNALVAALQKRLHRASRNQSLFVVRWSVVSCSWNPNLAT